MKKTSQILFQVVCFILISTGPALAQYDKNRTFKYLQETFNQHDKTLNNFLIVELEHYLHLFPKSKHARRVQYMLGNIHEKEGKKHIAVASYLKMLFLYPSAAGIAESTDSLHELITTDKSFANKREWLLDEIKKGSVKSYSANSYFRYLKIMMELDHKKLQEWTMDSCREFIRAFPTDKRNERVLIWIADLYMKDKDYKEAVTSYFKVTTVYPKSSLMPEIFYKRGVLKYEHLKENEAAIKVLGELVKKYPKSKFAAEALFLSGEIKEKKLKDYKGAIADYRKLVGTHSKSKKAADALWEIAVINKSKLKNHKAAILAYNKIVKKYPKNEKAIEAMEEAAKLYRSPLKDYESAAKTYARIADMYPSYKRAPDRLMEAGSICESNLKNTRKALVYYQRVIDMFPGHKKAQAAAKRIEKISKAKK